MSADIVNLRQARKQKQRRDKEQTAEDNRRKFGRTKAEREAARRRREALDQTVDGHYLGLADAGAPKPLSTDTSDD